MLEESKNSNESLLKKAFAQIRNGCGRVLCLNPLCASNPNFPKLSYEQSVDYVLYLANCVDLRKIQETGYFIFCPDQEVPNRHVSENNETMLYLMSLSNIEHFALSFILGKFTAEDPAIDWQGFSVFTMTIKRLYNELIIKDDLFYSIFRKIPFSRYTQLYLPRYCLLSIVLLAQIKTAHLPLIALNHCIMRNPALFDQISSWCDIFPSEILESIIDLFQSCITAQYSSLHNNSNYDDLYSSLKVFESIWKSNDRNIRVSYKKFYNESVNKELELASEFQKSKLSIKDRKRKYSSKWFSILDFPWMVDCETKTRLLQLEHYEAVEFQLTQFFIISIISGGNESPYLQLEINRDSMVEDVLRQITRKDKDLKKPLKVKFIGEEGVDEGGVKKEFFHLLVRKLFEDTHKIFSYKDNERVYWFNPQSHDWGLLELFGTVLGLAIFNCVNVDINFPTALYKKLQNTQLSILDLKQIDESTCKSLSKLLETTEDVSSFSLNFVVDTEENGQQAQYELVAGGRDLPVTNSNKADFVKLYADWKLNSCIEKQFDSFKRGFMKICGGGIVKLIRPEELELILCGSPVIDLSELEKIAVYENGYTRESRTVDMLWSILHSLDLDQKKKFLFFVTGSDRVPSGGFASIQFVISRNGPDSDRLMTAHTCYNYLLLPEYTCEVKMRKLLLTAINNSEGFGLR